MDQNVEILVHISATSRAADDARYRRMAQGFLDFQVARIHSVSEVPPKPTEQDVNRDEADNIHGTFSSACDDEGVWEGLEEGQHEQDHDNPRTTPQHSFIRKINDVVALKSTPSHTFNRPDRTTKIQIGRTPHHGRRERDPQGSRLYEASSRVPETPGPTAVDISGEWSDVVLTESPSSSHRREQDYDSEDARRAEKVSEPKAVTTPQARLHQKLQARRLASRRTPSHIFNRPKSTITSRVQVGRTPVVHHPERRVLEDSSKAVLVSDSFETLPNHASGRPVSDDIPKIQIGRTPVVHRPEPTAIDNTSEVLVVSDSFETLPSVVPDSQPSESHSRKRPFDPSIPARYHLELALPPAKRTCLQETDQQTPKQSSQEPSSSASNIQISSPAAKRQRLQTTEQQAHKCGYQESISLASNVEPNSPSIKRQRLQTIKQPSLKHKSQEPVPPATNIQYDSARVRRTPPPPLPQERSIWSASTTDSTENKSTSPHLQQRRLAPIESPLRTQSIWSRSTTDSTVSQPTVGYLLKPSRRADTKPTQKATMADNTRKTAPPAAPTDSLALLQSHAPSSAKLLLSSAPTRMTIITHEIKSPEPEASLAKFTTHMTPNLREFSKRIPLERISLQPLATPLRPLRTLERGCWEVNITEKWDQVTRDKFWDYLDRFISAGKAGMMTWCLGTMEVEGGVGGVEAGEGETVDDSQGIGKGKGKEKLGEPDLRDEFVQMYCWGELVVEVYLMMWCASDRRMNGMGAKWVDAGGEVIIQMA